MNEVLKLSVVNVFLSMVTFATNATSIPIAIGGCEPIRDADNQAINVCDYILGNDGFCTRLDDAIQILDDLKNQNIEFLNRFFDTKFTNGYTSFLIACKRSNWSNTPLIKIFEISNLHSELYLKFINQYRCYNETQLNPESENFIDRFQMPSILEIARYFPGPEYQKEIFNLYYEKMNNSDNTCKVFELLFNDCQNPAVNEPGYSLIAYLASTNQQFLIKNVVEFFSNSPKTILEILKSSGNNQLTPSKAARKQGHTGLARYLEKTQNDLKKADSK